MPLGNAIGIVTVAAFSVALLAVTVLPETRGKHLAVYD